MEAAGTADTTSYTGGNQLERIKCKLKNGYKAIFDAQSKDSTGDTDSAKNLYYQGISQITRVISLRCSSPELTDEYRKAVFIMNMAKERLRVLEHVVAEPTAPPEQDSQEDLCNLLDENLDDLHDVLTGVQEAREIISIPSGVSVFKVDGSGEVTKTHQNVSATINHLVSSKRNNPLSCLQIGKLVYPLVSKASPVLQVGEKQFMFPSLDKTNQYVGVVLENVDANQVKQFQNLIMSLTNLHVKSWDDVLSDDTSPSSHVVSSTPLRPPARPSPPVTNTTVKPYLRPEPAGPRTVDRVSSGIENTAAIVSAGLVWGSEVGGNLLRRGASSLKDRIAPSTRNVEISDNTRQQLQTIRTTTAEVSVLTGQAVCQLATGISALARLVAPHVSNGVKKLVDKSDNKLVTHAKGRISEQNMRDACQIGSSTLTGLMTLYEGLEDGAKNLGRALAEGANVTVSARYGEAAGEVAENSLHSVGNVGLTYSQARKLGGKALAKKAVKSTAAEVVRHNAVRDEKI